MIKAYGERTPQYVQDYLREKATKISVAGTHDEVKPQYGKTYRTPTLDDPRIHQNQIAGSYYPGDNQIIVTQLEYNTALKPDIGETPTLNGIARNRWRIQDPDEMAGVMTHETGHALSTAMGGIRDAPKFMEAYNRDIAKMGGPDAARKKGWGYFVHEEGSYKGREEVAAEGWAALNGGSGRIDQENFIKAFPESTQWLQDFHTRFENAYTTGGMAAADHLIYDTHNPLPEAKQSDINRANLDDQDTRQILNEKGQTELLQQYEAVMDKIPNTPETAILRSQLAYKVGAVNLTDSYAVGVVEVKSAIRQTNLPDDVKQQAQRLIDHVDNIQATKLRMDAALVADESARHTLKLKNQDELLNYYEAVFDKIPKTPETAILRNQIASSVQLAPTGDFSGFSSRAKIADSLGKTNLPDNVKRQVMDLLDHADSTRRAVYGKPVGIEALPKSDVASSTSTASAHVAPDIVSSTPAEATTHSPGPVVVKGEPLPTITTPHSSFEMATTATADASIVVVPETAAKAANLEKDAANLGRDASGVSRGLEVAGGLAPTVLGGVAGGVTAAVQGKSGAEIAKATGQGALIGAVDLEGYHTLRDSKKRPVDRALGGLRSATATTATGATIVALFTEGASLPVAGAAGLANLGIGVLQDVAHWTGAADNKGTIQNTYEAVRDFDKNVVEPNARAESAMYGAVLPLNIVAQSLYHDASLRSKISPQMGHALYQFNNINSQSSAQRVEEGSEFAKQLAKGLRDQGPEGDALRKAMTPALEKARATPNNMRARWMAMRNNSMPLMQI